MLRRLAPLVGINAVPLGGVFLAGWSLATALSLYWWESLIGATLVALRIALPRTLTSPPFSSWDPSASAK